MTANPGVSATPIIAGFAGLGGVFLAIGTAVVVRRHHFRKGADVAQGTIVSLQAVSPRSSNPGFADFSLVYKPTVRFVTNSGESIEAQARVGTNPAPGRVGQDVVVLYDPKDPTHFTTNLIGRRTGCIAWAFVVMGGLITAVALLVLVSI